MSEPRVAGLVCEGQTDLPILKAALQEVWPALEVRALQPETDDIGKATTPAGWGQVKAWCEARAESLEEVLDPDVGDPLDLLLIAVDVDIAVEAGVADPPQNVGLYETKRLRDTLTSWLLTKRRKRLPPAIVLSTPVMAIEAWVIAAFFPRERAPEQIADPASWLVTKRKLRRSTKDGKPWKELYLYRDEFAPKLAAKLKQVRKVCAEAERTLHLVEERRDQVEGA